MAVEVNMNIPVLFWGKAPCLSFFNGSENCEPRSKNKILNPGLSLMVANMKKPNTQ